MKFFKRLFITIILLVLIVVLLIIYKGYDMYKEATNEIDIDTKIIQFRQDKDYVIFEELPEDYVNAVIDVEDHRFYEHNGIDIISIFRALVNNIKEKSVVEGGSTITQQLAKNMYFTQEQKMTRKIAELFVVYELEKNYTKEDIFELYVNTSYFGDGYYGVGQATEGYLDKVPKDMTLFECTLLAGIPNAPSVYAPTKNPDLASQRQKRVIECMLEQEHISEEEKNKLYEELN